MREAGERLLFLLCLRGLLILGPMATGCAGGASGFSSMEAGLSVLHLREDYTANSEPPSLSKTLHNDETTTQEGYAKNLECPAFSDLPMVFTWLKNDKFLLNSTGKFLVIHKLNRTDAGEYRCIARNSMGAVRSLSTRIKVAYFKKLTEATDRVLRVNLGQAVILQFPPIESEPYPTITWSNETQSQPLSTEGRRYDFTSNGSLVILDIRISDNGTSFRARANNGYNPPVKSQYFNININDPRAHISEVPPEMIVAPSNITIIQGKATVAQFDCIVNARPLSDLTISWYHRKGSRVTNLTEQNSMYFLSHYRRQLKIKSPSPDHSGTYECVADWHNRNTKRSIKASGNLTVLIKPLIQHGDKNIRKDFGDTVIITCNASGHPQPKILWYFNAKEIKLLQNNRRYSIFPNGSLQIKNADLPDSGVYQCFAKNKAGESYTSSKLTVNSSPPILVMVPANITTLEETEVRLRCESKGAPKPSVVWTKVTSAGTENITSGGRLQVLSQGHLLITISKPGDSGMYTCTFFNTKGDVSVNAFLTVLVRTQIVEPPQNLSVIKATTALLKCGVDHDVTVAVAWKWFHYRPPLYVEQEVHESDRQKITDGNLEIRSVSGYDVGRYKCMVTSAAGNDSRIAWLKVMMLPFKPIIRSVTLDPNNPGIVIIRWDPGANGNSPIKRFIIQYKEIVPGAQSMPADGWITYQDVINSDSREHSIRELQPAKMYQFQIRAVNGVGEGPPSSPSPEKPLLMPQRPPSSAPGGLVGRPRSNSSIILMWQLPDRSTRNGPLLGYIICYVPNGYSDASNQYQNITDHTTTTYVLKGLIYFTHYDINIAAYNAKGIGVYSNKIRVWTDEGHPTAPPTNVQAVPWTSTAVNLTWDPPDQSQIFGINQGYKIIARSLKNASEVVRGVVYVDTQNLYGQQSHSLQRLQKFTKYSVTITCFTHKGNGPFSISKSVETLQDIPDEVSSIAFDDVRDTSVSVTWKPPRNINGILLGYIMFYQKKNDSSTKVKKEFESQKNQHTLSDLSPVTVYTIWLSAKTEVGPGPAKTADFQSGVTPEKPTAPYNLDVNEIQAHSALLRFIPGYPGKTSITKWIVEAKEENTPSWKEIYSISDPDATSIRVLNLNPYTSYRLRIKAENIVGQSNSSEASRTFLTSADRPGKSPGNVTVRALTANSLRVSWTLLTKKDWNGVPRGYEIYYKLEEEYDFKTVQLDNGVNKDSYILSGLQEWIKYEVKMTSFNYVGSSVFSPITTQRTKESVPSSGPGNVSAEANSSTSISVSWYKVPHFEQNGLILGYKIKYHSSEQSIPPKFKRVPGDTTYYSVLENLRKYVVYEIQVLAYTQMGDGVLSQSVLSVRTDEDVPDPPIIIYFPNVTYETAKVVWAPPLKPNGVIRGYRVSYRERGSASSAVVNNATMNASVHDYTAEGLQREKYYVFSVAACTGLGWGPSAEVLVFTMVNRQKPDSPSIPHIGSQVQARSIPISWQSGHDGYGPLRNFTIQYQVKPFVLWVTVPEVVKPDVSLYTVKGLLPDKIYRFRVAAANDIGVSNFSGPSNETHTLEDKPEGAPKNVRVVPLTTNSVNLTWQEPSKPTWNGPLKGFIVQYRQTNMANYQKTQVNYSTNTLWLGNLTSFVNYEFRVIAFNDIGSGPSSKPVIIFVGEAPPTASPQNLTAVALNSTKVIVQWLPPPTKTQNGELSGYKVYYRLISKNQNHEVIAQEMHIILEGLEVYSNYAVSVLAFNLAGEGPRSQECNISTLEGAPGKPRSLMFLWIMLESLNMSWSPPMKTNGLILSYEITYYEVHANDGESKLVQLTVNGNQLYYHAKDLEENTQYIFKVRAKTSAGLGQEKAGNVTTGPQPGSPEKVSKLNVQMTIRGVNISWTNADEGAYPINSYCLQARKNSGKSKRSVMCDCDAHRDRRSQETWLARRAEKDHWQTILQKESKQPGILINLHSFQTGSFYVFRVAAINKIGIGEFSEPSKAIRITALDHRGGNKSTDKGLISKAGPFHTKWWFLVIIALSGFIVILAVILLLCLIGRKTTTKREAKKHVKPMTSHLEPDDGGFSTFETRQSRHALSMRNGTLRNIRSPPRPSPASVTYSDDDTKPPLDDNSSSLTEKPSDFEDSTEPSEDESEVGSEKEPQQAFHNQFINDSVRESWKRQSQPAGGAYCYADSEDADSNQYAMSLNAGHMMMNNTAGSRAPVAGFSSFV